MNKNIEITAVLLSSILILLVWESPFVFPIKIFAVLIHEFSHAVISILTGGSVEKIIFNFDLSGYTETTGGSLILIAASGYPGSLIIGALLYTSADSLQLRKWLTNGLSALFLVFGINFVEGGAQIFLCLVIAAVFFLVPRFLNESINSILLRFIGLTSSLYVIADIKQDLLTLTLRETDTQILEYLTGIPAMVIGMTWFTISVATVYFLVKKSLKK